MNRQRFARTLSISIIVLICGQVSLLGFEDMRLPSFMKKEIPEGSPCAIFLYGYICVGCPIGFYLDSIKHDKNAVIIVPAEMAANDLENLVRAFALKGKIIRGSEGHVDLLKAVARKKGLDDWKANVILELKGKEIVRILIR